MLVLPSFSDDVSDAQVTVVMYELLTGHFDFFRNRGLSVFCRFLIGPQEFKPENQNWSRLFLRERRQAWEDPTCLTRWLFQTSYQSSVTNTQMALISEPEMPVSYICSLSRLGWGAIRFLLSPDMFDPLHFLLRHSLLCLTFLKHRQLRNQAGCLRLPQKLKPKLNEPR